MEIYGNIKLSYSEDGVVSCPNCSQLMTFQEYSDHVTECDSLKSDTIINTYRDLSDVASSLQSDSDVRVNCKYCERKFLRERIAKHQEACEFSSKKRPKFDMKRRRFPLSEFESEKLNPSLKRQTITSKFNDKK